MIGVAVENKTIEKAPDRLRVLEKIKEYERQGLFDRDVEDDPEGRTLMPDEINYLKRGPIHAIKRKIAFMSAYSFWNKAIKNKSIIMKDIIGAENLGGIDGGAIITCNHFNAFDSFVMQHVYDVSKKKKRMYRIIREGNYTSFPGYFGFLMRNCNTLPLSSSPATMRKFVHAVSEVLKDGHSVLIYPEQSMWWNYRKPKPHKIGAYQIATKSGVPVVPCFITLADSEIIGTDGFPVQEYTAHIGTPIYPDNSLPKRECAEKMMRESFEFSKSVYERVYGIPLVYETESEAKMA